ncbi:MAG TPA: GNAT family N-acetyltransferase [Desulfotomaculum sp.]|nr:GNAT family N-acetyltransferase [Desulfotomaculum sp.]
MQRADVADAEEILILQKAAFIKQAEMYNNYRLPPLIQELEDIKSEFKKYTFLKAVQGERIIGSVRACMEEDTCLIGRLIVYPSFQNRGIGTMLMLEVERIFDNAVRFELFTGHKSARNLHLYRKLGYSVFKSQKVSDNLNMVFLEKIPARG